MANSKQDLAKKRRVQKRPLKAQPATRSRVCRVPRQGQKCTKCRKGRLDYDGLLQLCCPVCGHLASGGGFT